nr:MAG TPA: hypothetical protein [Caudoviricetes sp.]
MFNFLTSFPYLDYIISRYTEKVKRFDEVFSKKGAKKGQKCRKLLENVVKTIILKLKI